MNHEPLLLHLHIPKTGGVTLNHYIYDQLHTPEYYVAENGFLHAGIYYYPDGFFKESQGSLDSTVTRVLRRPDLRAVVGHFKFGIHEYIARPATYTTILRHPVDRILSLFYHLGREETLEQFAHCPPFREVDNDQTRRISGVEPPLGQCTSSMLEQAKENLIDHFEVVGTTQRLYEMLILLKRSFGWTNELVCYFQNATTGRPGAREISHETREVILERNQLDLDLFKFAEESLQERIDREGKTFADEYNTVRKELSLPSAPAK